MDERRVVKTIIDGKGIIVLDEKTFDKIRQLCVYNASDDKFPYRIYGIPIIWVEGGFREVIKRVEG